mmetsp:Transcript_16129/g.39270  ORF Transcript_16129/g.39270 Transcript_16129/m.39270 type:complete len:236 (+) Transcript_16129:60-767(+)
MVCTLMCLLRTLPSLSQPSSRAAPATCPTGTCRSRCGLATRAALRATRRIPRAGLCSGTRTWNWMRFHTIGTRSTRRTCGTAIYPLAHQFLWVRGSGRASWCTPTRSAGSCCAGGSARRRASTAGEWAPRRTRRSTCRCVRGRCARRCPSSSSPLRTHEDLWAPLGTPSTSRNPSETLGGRGVCVGNVCVLSGGVYIRAVNSSPPCTRVALWASLGAPLTRSLGGVGCVRGIIDQ